MGMPIRFEKWDGKVCLRVLWCTWRGVVLEAKQSNTRQNAGITSRKTQLQTKTNPEPDMAMAQRFAQLQGAHVLLTRLQLVIRDDTVCLCAAWTAWNRKLLEANTSAKQTSGYIAASQAKLGAKHKRNIEAAMAESLARLQDARVLLAMLHVTGRDDAACLRAVCCAWRRLVSEQKRFAPIDTQFDSEASTERV